SKKIDNSEDFILAGKGLGTVVLMGTLLATWVGSGTVTGGPNSLAYSFGLWPAIFYTIPSIIGILIMFKIAPKVRAYGKYTVSEILEINYGPPARIIAAIVIILAYVGIVAYQYRGLGFVLNVTTGIDIGLGTTLAAALIIFLATIGGLMSVAPTDALSAGLILLGLLVGVPSVIIAAGGWSEIVANVPASHSTVTGGLSGLQLLGYYLPLLALLLADQNMYQRLAASKEDESSRKAIIGWIIGLIVVTPAVSIISFASRSMFPEIDPGMSLISSTLVMPTFAGGILLAAAAAFIVTTGNSYLLSCATNVTYDIFTRFIKKDATDKQQLIFTRVLVVVLGIFAYVLIQYFPSILALQMYAYTVYGASLTPAVLAIFFWKRVNKYGGIASMLTGMITTMLWEIPLGKPFGMNSVLIALPLAIIALYLGTILTENKIKKEEMSDKKSN
ncbi:MAG: sodium:solute symporter family protein, partial [Bacillota bacterium]|nr:sodium:solute symporter family protein [Bacillota bacterium]